MEHYSRITCHLGRHFLLNKEKVAVSSSFRSEKLPGYSMSFGNNLHFPSLPEILVCLTTLNCPGVDNIFQPLPTPPLKELIPHSHQNNHGFIRYRFNRLYIKKNRPMMSHHDQNIAIRGSLQLLIALGACNPAG